MKFSIARFDDHNVLCLIPDDITEQARILVTLGIDPIMLDPFVVEEKPKVKKKPYKLTKMTVQTCDFCHKGYPVKQFKTKVGKHVCGSKPCLRRYQNWRNDKKREDELKRERMMHEHNLMNAKEKLEEKGFRVTFNQKAPKN